LKKRFNRDKDRVCERRPRIRNGTLGRTDTLGNLEKPQPRQKVVVIAVFACILCLPHGRGTRLFCVAPREKEKKNF
jgi:hypothetical protein